MLRSVILTLAAIIVLIGIVFAFGQPDTTPGPIPQSAANTPLPTGEEAIEVIAENLEIPWEIAFLPDGTLLVTERPGRLLKIGQDKSVIPIEGVQHVGEGGLLGLALHPSFSQNNFIYLYLTTNQGNGLTNRVERYRLEGTQLLNRQIIIENIPGSTFHDGGRIAFGPDGKLYITTGDAGNEPSAQDTNSLAGKILRLNDDGSIPADNPFDNAAYSYGHRNPQGLAWDEEELWITEHGRSGSLSGFDEINHIAPGKNYGWPTIQGDETKEGMEAPSAHSGSRTTWAPSGAVFHNGNLWFAGLRGEALYEAKISGNNVQEVVAHFSNEFGRLRTVAAAPDGSLYILTNNRDGRGRPAADDDKIIRINPETL